MQSGPTRGQPLFTAPTIAALLVYFAYALQCMATVGIMRRETGTWKWPVIAFGLPDRAGLGDGVRGQDRRGGRVVIALHAERVPGEPHAVRWVAATDGVPAGRVVSAPGDLGARFADGTLAAGLVEHTAVWLWLRDGLSWRDEGPAIQAALRAALAEPFGWAIQPAAGEILERVTADLLDGSVGDFVRSHGGSVAAERDGDVVTIRLGGACEHCPAAGHTLHQRLIGELRRRCPDLVELESRGGQLKLQLGGLPVSGVGP